MAERPASIDAAPADGALDPARAALVAVSAAIGTRDAVCLRDALDQAHGVAPPDQVDEVILQAHLFVGYPDAINAMATWRELSGEPAVAAVLEPAVEWIGRGEEVCAVVYGKNYPKLRQNVRALHPELDRWMIEDGYGRVLGRGGLDLATRELCVVALLATWGAPRQLHSHLRGALNAGATTAEADHAVQLALRLLPPEQRPAVRQLGTTVAAAFGGSSDVHPSLSPKQDHVP